MDFVPGIGSSPRTFFREGFARTSFLVVVSGLSCAGSLHFVSLPGAAPESSYPGLISRNERSRSLVRYARSATCRRDSRMRF